MVAKYASTITTINSMKTYLKVIIGLIIFVAVSFGVIYAAGIYALPDFFVEDVDKISPETSSELIGKKLPNFNLSDMTGDRKSSGELVGKPFVVIFWATWNNQSTDQIKIIDDYLSHRKNSSALIDIITINSQEEASVVSSFMKRSGYSVPVLMDTLGQVSSIFNVKSLPVAYFGDKNGYIREIELGIMSEKLFVEKTEDFLRNAVYNN